MIYFFTKKNTFQKKKCVISYYEINQKSWGERESGDCRERKGQ